MSSSSRYTHLLRSNAEARVVKVQYSTKQSINTNALYSSIGCNPNYSIIDYSYPCCQTPQLYISPTTKQLKLEVFIISGGTPDNMIYNDEIVNTYDGGSP